MLVAFVKEPEDFDAPLEEHYEHTMLMKNLHTVSRSFKNKVDVAFVDYHKDPDNIAFSLGLDTLAPEFFPVVVLFSKNTMYIAMKKITNSYFLLSNFIENTYQKSSLTAWPL